MHQPHSLCYFDPRLKRKHNGYGDTFFNEVFVKINGKQHYLWRAVDQDGEVVDVFAQAKRDGAAAFRRLKSVRQAQRFLGAHAAVHNLFDLGLHLVMAEHYRNLRMSAFTEWGRAVA